MSATQNRTFTWEGRCYEAKYPDMELLNVTLCTSNESMVPIINLINTTFGNQIILYDHSWSDQSEDEIVNFATIVIEEKTQDEFFAHLKKNGYKET